MYSFATFYVVMLIHIRWEQLMNRWCASLIMFRWFVLWHAARDQARAPAGIVIEVLNPLSFEWIFANHYIYFRKLLKH